jgi:hypothetical protein
MDALFAVICIIVLGMILLLVGKMGLDLFLFLWNIV